MRQQTIDALNRINLRFYSRQAHEFDATRQRPWPGWNLLSRFLQATLENLRDRLPVVADLGCGNGRFLHFLEANELAFEYLGIDSSLPLLRLARERAPSRRWLAADLSRGAPFAKAPQFDVVAALAVLHHIPSRRLRRQFLRYSIDGLREGGLLFVSHWQFEDVPALLARRVEWATHREAGLDEGLALEESDLEDGDHLLAWGDSRRSQELSYRYCHHTTDREAEGLVAGLPLRLVSQFRADGRTGELNLYRVFRRSDAAAQ